MLRQAIAIFAVASVIVASSAVAVSCSSSSSASDGGSDGKTGNEAGDGGKDARAQDSAKDSKGLADGSIPLLAFLSVTATGGADASTIALIPPFSPGITDYYVRCPASTNALTVTITPSHGAEGQLLQPSSSASPPSPAQQILPLSVDSNQAIVAAAIEGSQLHEYWVRCLGPDFPQMQWGAHPEAGTPTPGYYLVGSFTVPKGESAYAIVLDSNGVPVWYFREDSPKTGVGIDNVDTVIDGSISFMPFPNGPFPYEIHQLDPLVTTFVSAVALDEHEFQVLPNGDYLVLTNPLLQGVDLHGLQVPLSDSGVETFGANSGIQDCYVLELSPSGGPPVWGWYASNHFDPGTVSTYPTFSDEVTLADGGAVVDTFHCNSIDVDRSNGNLLVSARNMDSIWYIDKETKEVVWKLGGAASSMDPNTVFIEADHPFYRQHDARMQPSWSMGCTAGAGQISVFDDETAMDASARGALYSVSVTLDGGIGGDCSASPTDAGANGATLIWDFPGQVPSAACGSFRILSDGSRTIGWGQTLNFGPTPGWIFAEVNEAKADLLDFYFRNPTNTSYRAIKVPLSALSLSAMRNTSGGAGQ
jgi:arylsulfotransferase ASST